MLYPNPSYTASTARSPPSADPYFDLACHTLGDLKTIAATSGVEDYLGLRSIAYVPWHTSENLIATKA